MSRTSNSIRNIFYGAGFQVITMIFSFISRTLQIKYIGIEALSLGGLFTEVISALSLAELGIGTSIAFNLYKPVANGDQERICQLMQLYRTAYRIIAGLTFIIGIVICPFIQYIINDISYDLGYIRLIYVLFVVQLSSSYLFSYKFSLLNIDQKNYVHTKITGGIKIVGTLIQFVLIVLTCDYLVFLISNIVIGLVSNVVCSRTVDKMYPFLNRKVSAIDKAERKGIYANMKNIFIKGVSTRVTTSTDNILISVLVSTSLVGFYSNYMMIINIFRTGVALIYNGVLNSMGNLMTIGDNEHCERVFKRINYALYIIGLIGAACILNCINPFIILWIGEEYLLEIEIVFACCLCLLIEIICKGLWMTMEVSGLFSLDKYAAIAGTTMNLIVSIVLGIRYGITGIIIGTCMTYIVQMFLKAYFLYKKRWQKSPIKYYRNWFFQMCIGVLLMIGSVFVCSLIRCTSPVLQFILKGGISVALVMVVVVLTSFKTDEFRYVFNFVKNKIFRR